MRAFFFFFCFFLSVVGRKEEVSFCLFVFSIDREKIYSFINRNHQEEVEAVSLKVQK